MLFTSAKVSHLALLPQEVEHNRRVVSMVHQMDKEGFGMLKHQGACSGVPEGDLGYKYRPDEPAIFFLR